MGEHRRREISFRIKLLCFFCGALLVAASVLEFIYRSPMGLFGTRATGKILALGVIFMVAATWSFFRKKTPAARN